ncbi:4-hydroxyphenylacetate 3-hydroxylase N-terminal domain-containing protein [Shigella flexneri]
MKPEDFRAGAQHPYTGEEYLKSPQDGRRDLYLWRASEDVTAHPAFRNAGKRLLPDCYDALHKPEMQTLCWNTDTGSGGYTHKFFRVAKSADDLRHNATPSLVVTPELWLRWAVPQTTKPLSVAHCWTAENPDFYRSVRAERP